MIEPQSAVEEKSAPKHVESLEDLLLKIKAYFPQADVAIVEKAYRFSEKAHEGQFRRSGEPYISHPLSVAGILADYHLDLDSIMTGILHDTVEDTAVTLDDVRREFGETVAGLVDGVTKISQIKVRSAHEKQGENLRKMVMAMGKDVRVILVKLADRLHNMRTLNHVPYEKQARIALETLEIYAPLAGRLGINTLKIELEDLCFRYYRPDVYYNIVQKIKKSEGDRGRYIENVKHLISQSVDKTGIKCEVYGRAKHLWSIYRKMESRNIEYEQLYDVLAFRVIVGSIGDCYGVLGHIHSLWKPVPGRFKDFIAMPKTNNYQSLHTTVIGPDGERIEIQIRTKDMHDIAEKGIAAHWRYKERGKIEDDSLQQANWLRDLVQLHQNTKNSEEFLETVKSDLWEQEVYVFTPNGDVREFPEGATPVDFAYAIHTDLGSKIVGARINGKMVPLRYVLQNGDSVEVVTSKTQQPSKDWLKFVVTTKAKSKIRQFVKEEQRRRSLVLGKELLEKEYRRFGHSALKFLKGELFERFLKDNGLPSLDDLHIRIGYGKLEARHVVENTIPGGIKGSQLDVPVSENPAVVADSTVMERIVKSAAQKSKKTHSLVHVDGMDDVLVHFAKCCHPIPGDSISGYISRGRGVMIHRSDCPKAFELDQLRKVEVTWAVKQAADGMERVVRLRVIAQDMPGLLKLMSEAFASQEINIQSAQVRTTKDKKAVCSFEISVKDTSQLTQAILAIQKIKGVIGVNRVIA